MLNDKKVIKKNHTIQKKHIMRSIKRNASVSPLTENRSYPGAHVIDIWFLSVSVIKLLVWKKKKIQKKPSAKNTQNLKKIIFFFQYTISINIFMLEGCWSNFTHFFLRVWIFQTWHSVMKICLDSLDFSSPNYWNTFWCPLWKS